jgi:hypothetical protein
VENEPKVRIEWVGFDDVPEAVRLHAEAEAQRFRTQCQRMRGMTIERRRGDPASTHRLICRCLDRTRCLQVSRTTVTEALAALEQRLGSYCRDPGR